MAWETVYDCMGIIRDRFGFMRAVDGTLTAKEIIEAAEPWLEQHGGEKRGLVIDPWNELEHWRPKNQTETEYVSHTLSYVRNWARPNKVHVFIVAHPQKMRREDGKLPIPRPDMIAGSQHWWNKADNAVTVWRDMENPDDPARRHPRPEGPLQAHRPSRGSSRCATTA
jgi:twinkle protein